MSVYPKLNAALLNDWKKDALKEIKYIWHKPIDYEQARVELEHQERILTLIRYLTEKGIE